MPRSLDRRLVCDTPSCRSPLNRRRHGSCLLVLVLVLALLPLQPCPAMPCARYHTLRFVPCIPWLNEVGGACLVPGVAPGCMPTYRP